MKWPEWDECPRAPARLTEEEIQIEKKYRLEERLGILCGADVPTDEQMAIAVRESNEWEADYRKTFL